MRPKWIRSGPSCARCIHRSGRRAPCPRRSVTAMQRQLSRPHPSDWGCGHDASERFLPCLSRGERRVFGRVLLFALHLCPSDFPCLVLFACQALRTEYMTYVCVCRNDIYWTRCFSERRCYRVARVHAACTPRPLQARAPRYYACMHCTPGVTCVSICAPGLWRATDC